VTSRLDSYLNPAAFESSGTEFGNLGRNTVIGPDQRRLDLSVSKTTRITNAQSLEFRLEAYNVTTRRRSAIRHATSAPPTSGRSPGRAADRE